jgi:ankyrin repeat protein/nucleoside phosphorylase
MEGSDSLKRTGTGLGVVSSRSKRTRHDENSDGSPKPLKPEEYRVGWICALSIERTAAEAMLEEEHAPLAFQSERDTNAYTLGRIGPHNIVIAGLPNDHFGLNNATAVANNMLRTFPFINRRLMVGIGGAAPDLADIRLGDVVISNQVIQYDFGKAVSGDQLDTTSIPTRPPQGLLNAVAKLRAMHNRLPSRIPSIVNDMLERYPKMVDFRRPTSRDVLYDYSYKHVSSSSGGCTECDEQSILGRGDRPSNDPMIHYGKIASANQVMRNGAVRKRITDELQVACFEMEAAGLMDDPIGCLVIRGMCDYSDSHKNKEWQKYASAVAAAYASELLHVLPTTVSSDRQEETADTEHSSLQPLAQEHSLSADERRQKLLDSLAFEEQDSRHNNIKAALKKTCEWFRTDDFYLRWLNPACYPDHHGFLWISGKPGSGKSTLMKFLLSDVTKRSGRQSGTAVVSFFFNARGTELEKSTLGLYRSLLFQILTKFSDLQWLLDRHLNVDSYCTLETLQTLFQNTIGALQHRKLICFIDALDECDEEQVRKMIELFEELGETAEVSGTQFYICLSSRHYPHVEIQPCLRRTLEDQPGHTADIQKYVSAKLRPASRKDKVGTEISALILEKAGGVFMWVVLVVDILNKELRDGRATTIKKHLQSLPSGLTDLFRKVILRDSANNDSLLLCIQWILFAKRPLQVEEYYYALHSGLDPGEETLSPHDPEFVTREYMELFVISSSKGLAEVTRTKKAIVQFIHESVRDFLLKEDGLRHLSSAHEGSFEAHSHDQLKECCHFYLGVDVSPHQPANRKRASVSKRKSLRQMVPEKFPFLAYATAYLLHHADMAERFVPQDNFLGDFNLGQWLSCHRLFEIYKIRDYSSEVNLVYLCADMGYSRLLKSALRKVPLPAACWKDRYIHPLIAASANGHVEALRVLLDSRGVGINLHDKDDHSAVSIAVERGHGDVIEALLTAEGTGAHDESAGRLSPGLLALDWPQRAIHKLLVEYGDISSTGLNERYWWLIVKHKAWSVLLKLGTDLNEPIGRSGQPPLIWAACHDYRDLVKWLLTQDGVDVNAGDKYEQTALSQAVDNGHLEVVDLLLEHDGIDLHWAPALGGSILHRAIRIGSDVDMLKALLVTSLDLNARDAEGMTALSVAVLNKDRYAMALLISRPEVDLNLRDNMGRTPLSLAISELSPPSSLPKIVRQLLDAGNRVDVNIPAFAHNQTPLMIAAMQGGHDIMKLLLSVDGIRVNSKSRSGRTALSYACDVNWTRCISLLLATPGIDVNARGEKLWTPLMWTACRGHTEALQQLLSVDGIGVNDQDENGRTALSIAIDSSYEQFAMMLLDSGRVEVNLEDPWARTALSKATSKRWTKVVERMIALDRIDVES